MKSALKVILPVVVTAMGIGVLMFMVKTKPPPPRVDRAQSGLLVTTETLRSGEHAVTVRAQGQVVAARQVIVAPEVTGRIRWQSENLVPGGRLARGDSIVRIDARDYQLQVESRSADVNRAQLELQLERGRQRVAEREWQAFGDGEDQEGQRLALRQPQVETAEVSVRSARSAVQQARLNLSKTNIRAPFNAMVIQESAELGQLVGPSASLATLVGTDEFFVRVSVPVENLASIRIPDRDGEGSPARVWQEIGGRHVERQGHVVRLLPDVDPIGAMARVLVSIEDPMAFTEANADSLPILLSSFVTVDIEVAAIADAISVPRLAVRDGDRTFVMNDDGTLSIRDLTVVWRTEDALLVRSGVRAGERLITSRIATPVEGMALRVADTAPEAHAEAPAAESEEATQ
ncbi:MAG: efflux RND transporter periplasmic adaptor subunit [Myxococcota bacterium]